VSKVEAKTHHLQDNFLDTASTKPTRAMKVTWRVERKGAVLQLGLRAGMGSCLEMSAPRFKCRA
jgi:hypothetical protein